MIIRNKAYGVALAVLIAGCSGADDTTSGAQPAGAAAQTPRGGNGPATPTGPGMGGPGRGGVTLAATDISPVKRGTVEDAVAVTGNLQPLERIEVRARLEGELKNVIVREGDRVRPGQLLARFEDSEQSSAFQSAEADRAAARTEFSTAQWNLDQTRELFKEGAVPERDVKAGEQQVASARARLAAAEARVRATSSALSDTRILAPSAAMVEKRLTSNGEHVNRGASLFTLVRTEMLELTGAVPARSANRVQPGQNVRFNADGREFTGRVARVSPTIDPASRSVSVYIQIPNADGGLKGGTFASGRIVSRVAENVLVVPTAAIKQTAETGAPYVYRIEGDMLERAPIELGLVDEGRGIAEVVSGLEENDRIVTGTVSTVARSAKVTIVGEARTNPNGAQQRNPPPVPRN